MTERAEPTEAALVALARDGDTAAFGALYDRHVQTVYRFTLRRCGDPYSAEDLLSVVFLELWRGRERLVAVDESARPWFLGVATNVMRNSHRSARRHADAISRYEAHVDADTVDFADAAGDRVDAARAATQLPAAINSLPAKERDVATLVLLEELTSAAAAVALGIPEGTVKSRLASARRRLQRVLQTSELPIQRTAADMNKVSGTLPLRPEASPR